VTGKHQDPTIWKNKGGWGGCIISGVVLFWGGTIAAGLGVSLSSESHRSTDAQQEYRGHVKNNLEKSKSELKIPRPRELCQSNEGKKEASMSQVCRRSSNSRDYGKKELGGGCHFLPTLRIGRPRRHTVHTQGKLTGSTGGVERVSTERVNRKRLPKK